jgi:hypothetical protein
MFKLKRGYDMNTPSSHCPGFESFRDLKSFICKCHNCGMEMEIFSDEFDRQHKCKGCHEQLDFSKCEYQGGGSDPSPR